MVQALDDAPETVAKLLALLTESNIKIVKTHLAFVTHYVQPMFNLILPVSKST